MVSICLAAPILSRRARLYSKIKCEGYCFKTHTTFAGFLGLWIHFHILRIRLFFSMRIRLQLKKLRCDFLNLLKCWKTSVADPEWFILDPDPALNFPSSGSRQKFLIRIQPILIKYRIEIIQKHTLNSSKRRKLTTICHSRFHTTVL